MKKIFAALALVVLCATTAIAHPRDKNNRYLFLNEVDGIVTYVDSQSLKVIPNSGGIVSYYTAMEFTDSSSKVYNDIKKEFPAYKPAFVFNNIALNCTTGQFKILKATVAGTTEENSKPVVLFNLSWNLNEVEWTTVTNGLSDRAKQIICKPALGVAQ